MVLQSWGTYGQNSSVWKRNIRVPRSKLIQNSQKGKSMIVAGIYLFIGTLSVQCTKLCVFGDGLFAGTLCCPVRTHWEETKLAAALTSSRFVQLLAPLQCKALFSFFHASSFHYLGTKTIFTIFNFQFSIFNRRRLPYKIIF